MHRNPFPPRTRPPLTAVAYRGVVVALTAVAVVAQVVHLDSLYWNLLGFAGSWAGHTTSSFLTVAVMDATLTGGASIVALLLVFRGESERGAHPLAVVLAVWSYLLAYSAVVTFLRPDDPESSARLVFEAHFLVIELLGLASLVRFASVFPRPLDASDLRVADELPVLMRPLQKIRRALLRPVVLWISAAVAAAVVLGLNQTMGRAAQDAALLPLVDVLRFVALALVVVNMRRAYLSASTVHRERLHWVALGFAVLVGCLGALIGGNVLVTVTGWSVPVINWRPVVLALGVMGMILGAAAGVMSDGSRDPAHMVRRAVILSFLVLATLLLASAFEALLSDAAVARLSLPSGVGTVAALGLMSLVHTRLRIPLEHVFDHAWNGIPDPHPTTDP